ncbi:MAG: hypothetical protein ACRYG2_00780 [Janthinobacterium lividum]
MEIDEREAAPADHALDGFSTALQHLTELVEDGGLPVLDDVGQDEDLPRHGQRIHDALEEVRDPLLRSGAPPDPGGTPPR